MICKHLVLVDILKYTPFTFVSVKLRRGLQYTFYHRKNWDTPSRAPQPYEVFGVTITGYPKASAFAEGLALGYAQKRILINKNGGPSATNKATMAQGAAVA